MWIHYFWCECWFLYGGQPCLSSECAGCYSLDREYDWCCGVQRLHWIYLGPPLFSVAVGGGVYSPVVWLDTLRVRKSSTALECVPCPKGGYHWSTWDPCGHSECMHHLYRHPCFCPEAAERCNPFSVVLIPDLVLGCGVEWAGAGGWGTVATRRLCCSLGPGLPLWQTSLRTCCPRFSFKLWCGVDGARVLPLGNEPLHIPPQKDMHFCGALWCAHWQSSPRPDPSHPASVHSGHCCLAWTLPGLSQGS